jgi:hypothetical protein
MLAALAGLLALDRETGAALRATRGNDGATALGLHAYQKTMGAFAAHNGRLISTFHDAISLEEKTN